MLTRASASDDSPFRPNCHLTAETLEEHVPCGRCSRSPWRRRQVRSGLPAGGGSQLRTRLWKPNSDSGLGNALTGAKKVISSVLHGPIPYASEQGIFCGLAGNLNRRSGKLPPSSGNPLSSAIWAAQSDPPRDLEGCREGQRGAPPDCSRSRGPRQRELARRARAATLAIRCFAPGRRGSRFAGPNPGCAN